MVVAETEEEARRKLTQGDGYPHDVSLTDIVDAIPSGNYSRAVLKATHEIEDDD